MIIMETSEICVDSDDREEGEILDDELEDISDNSLNVSLYTGKSVSHKDHLRALSLSSVSEVEENRVSGAKNHTGHRRPVRRRSSRYKRRRKRSFHKTGFSSESDDGTPQTKKFQQQLKKAVCVEKDDKHRNSLQTRLRAMTNNQTENYSETVFPTLTPLDVDDDFLEGDSNLLLDQPKVGAEAKEIEIDNELIQLRLEALKTAVINKFQRKKRKTRQASETAALSDASLKSDNSETNKENTHKANTEIITDIGAVKATPEVRESSKKETQNTSLQEDDEDVLRALLLASMSKKMTNQIQPEAEIKLDDDKNSSAQMQKTVNKTSKLVNHYSSNKQIRKVNTKIQTKFKLPTVKPLIINVNSDSDTEDEPDSKKSENKLEKNKSSELDIQNSVDQFLKEQWARVESQAAKTPTSLNNKKSSAILEKSAVKLLPKSKQIEYQKLLQKIRSAEHKPRVRRLSLRAPDTKVNVKKVPRNKLVNSKFTTSQKVGRTLQESDDLLTVQKAIKSLQVPKNGRLQIQEKYKPLVPILKKLNETRNEKNKLDLHIKQLFEEILETKKKLASCSDDFTKLLTKLSSEKEKIDTISCKDTNLQNIVSSPVKSKIHQENVNLDKPEVLNIPSITPECSTDIVNKDIEDSTEPEDLIVPVNFGDPNDIHMIINEEQKRLERAFPVYVSPLDSNQRTKLDPLGVMCPFEVDGSCRDADCKYKHFM